MRSSVLIELTAGQNHSTNLIGKLGRNLEQLLAQQLPIPRTAVIPQEILEQITEETELKQQLRTSLNLLGFTQEEAQPNQSQQAEFLAQVKNTVRQLRVPGEISYTIIDWYQQQPGYYRVTTADDQFRRQEHQNVIGEANLLDSILAIWAEHLELDFEAQELKLYAPSILIQYQGQPTASGVVLTQAPERKSQLLLRSVWGVYPTAGRQLEADEFYYDLRTHQIVSRKLQPQAVKLQRASDKLLQKAVLHYRQENYSLSEAQAQKLGQLASAVKRLSLDKQVVHWFLLDDQFFISRVEDLAESSEKISTEPRRVIVKGHPIQAGIVAGEVFVAQNPKEAKNLKPNHVLVVKKFDSRYQAAISQVIAIVTDQDLTNPMLSQQLRKEAVPTIINTKQATLQLKNGQQVLIDANAGQVLEVKTPNQRRVANPAPHAPTITKVYISAGNPFKARDYVTTQVDGVGVLRSEYTLAKLGTHPLQMIRGKQQEKLKLALKQAINEYRQTRPNLPVIYRSQNLTSQELSMLEKAESYEAAEINPYLGFRGGVQLLRRFEYLDLEAGLIEELLQENPSPLGLMLPFIRTPSELHLIVKHLEQQFNLFTQQNFKLYLQLNTPANVRQLKSYFSGLRPGLVSGIAVDIRSLHALAFGVDPTNPELFALYPYDFELMKQLLTEVMTTVRQLQSEPTQNKPLKTMLLLEDHNLSLIELAVELGYHSITVKPNFVNRVKTRVQELEAERFQTSVE